MRILQGAVTITEFVVFKCSYMSQKLIERALSLIDPEDDLFILC